MYRVGDLEVTAAPVLIKPAWRTRPPEPENVSTIGDDPEDTFAANPPRAHGIIGFFSKRALSCSSVLRRDTHATLPNSKPIPSVSENF